jgi:hypothetical protein
MSDRLAACFVALVTALALTACGGSSSTSSAHSSTASDSSATSASATASGGTASSGTEMGYEGVPLELGSQIAPADTTQTGRVDGISCGPTEQLAYHIHAHLAVFDNARIYSLPAGVGIPGSSAAQTQYGPIAAGGRCFYWLHTHTADGIIHIESPTQRIYTLGDFFDIWDQPLTSTRVGDLHGHITAYLNGKAWTQDVRAIPLLPHGLIQLDIGEPMPPLMTVNWSRTGL